MLNDHIRRAHSKPSNCSQCGESFERKDSLRNHVKSVHEQKFIKCNSCDVKISDRNIKRHQIKCQNKEKEVENDPEETIVEEEININKPSKRIFEYKTYKCNANRIIYCIK